MFLKDLIKYLNENELINHKNVSLNLSSVDNIQKRSYVSNLIKDNSVEVDLGVCIDSNFFTSVLDEKIYLLLMMRFLNFGIISLAVLIALFI